MRKMIKIMAVLPALALLYACGDDAPKKENEEELIDRVQLIFIPTEGETVFATAFDEDGEGPGGYEIDGILLQPNTTYELSIELDNTIEGEDITAEIEEEDDEHMFFFAFTNNAFSNPAGNGNVDNRADAVNYDDEDENELPVGLSTTWTTGTGITGATFRVVLKHQPGIKTGTSTAATGETDIDIEFPLTIASPVIVVTRQ